MKHKWLVNALAILFLVTGLFSGFVNAPVGMAASAESNTADKIDPALLNKFATDGQADFIARFTEQADLSSAQTMGWNERGEFVYNTLTETAARSQANAKGILEALNLQYKSFFSGNDLYVFKGTAEAANALAALPEVQYIRAPRTFQMDPVTTENPLLSIKWPGDLLASNLIESPASPDALAWGISYTKADQFWMTYGNRGSGIVVANIDSGVQWDHPALDQAYKCAGDPGNDACWDDPSLVCPDDEPCVGPAGSHGTHTMGTMVADDDPTLPWIAGMAPDAQWIACLGCDLAPNGCSEEALMACGDWIVAPDGDPNNRPDVVNNSWGGGTGDPWYKSYVNAWRDAGIFPAFSAGNTGPGCATISDPGAYQESFASAAIDSSGTIADFSGRGPSYWGDSPYTKPNISAPGVAVCSTVGGDGWDCSYSGTSMASPHTAGAVALLWSADPSLIGDIDGTFQLLQDSATDTPAGNCGAPDGDSNYTYGYGYLDLMSAAALDGLTPVETGTLEGTVTDAASGLPIEGADVEATPSSGKGSSVDAITDPSGFYTMDLPVGMWDLVVTKYGYEFPIITDIEVLAGQTTVQDVQGVFQGSWISGPDIHTCFDMYRMDSKYYAPTGLIYILGGRVGSATTDGSIFTFDPATGICADTGVDMPTPISNYTINIVNDGTKDLLCTFGGRDPSAVNTLDVQCYDPIANTAFVKTTLPTAYNGFIPSAQVVLNNNVYVIGGLRTTASPYALARTDRYDPVANTFTQLGDLSLARGYIDAAVYDGKIYAIGGTTFDGTNLYAQTIVEVMADPEGAGTWDDAAVPDLPDATAEGRAFGFEVGSGYGLDGKIVIVGGGQWPGNSADVVVFDVASGVYDNTIFPDLQQARRDFGGTLITDYTPDTQDPFPSIWVIGGQSGSDDPPYGAIEYYPLPANLFNPDLMVEAPPLEATIIEGSGQTVTLDMLLSEVGGESLDWALQELPDEVLYESPAIPVTGKAPLPEKLPKAFVPARKADVMSRGGFALLPDDILWDQPNGVSGYGGLSAWDYTYGVGIFSADDFENDQAWLIDTISMDGFDSLGGFTGVVTFTWYIYPDAGGVPAGFPGDGSGAEVWSFQALSTDPYVTVGAAGYDGVDLDVVGGTSVPLYLPSGHYWFVFAPYVDLVGSDAYYWFFADPNTNLEYPQIIDPDDLFGAGLTSWTPWPYLSANGTDMSFRLEGSVFDVPWLSEDPTSGTLPAFGTQNVAVTFDATDLTAGEYTAALNVYQISNSLGSSTDAVSVTLPVMLTVIPMTTGVSLTPETDAMNGDPGEVVEYMLTVENTGNFTDTFDLAVDSAVWDTQLSEASVELAAGDTADVSVMVTVPTDAMAGDMDVATITATSQRDNMVMDDSMLTTTANAVYGAVLAPDTQDGYGDPGAMVEYTVTLTNTGNDMDTFALTYKGDWEATLPVTSTELDSGESLDFVVQVMVPTDAMAGDVDEGAVVVSSAGSGSDIWAMVNTYANAVYGFELMPEMYGKSGMPGSVVTYTLELTNLANITDTFTLTYTAGWETVVPMEFELAAGESTMFDVVVTIPMDAAKGDFDVAMITVISAGDGSEAMSELTTTAYVEGYMLYLPITFVTR
jgi:uncharacterized membrane protein/subtilisin family serine protease